MPKPKPRRRSRHSPFRRAPVGAPPGEILPPPDAPRPKVRALAYGPHGHEEHEVADLEQLRALRGRFPVLWVNVDGLGDAAAIAKIGEIFNLHRLALEDVANVHQRSKVEPYAEQVFIVVREAEYNERVETDQVSIFLGADYIVSFQEREGDSFEHLRQRIRTCRGRVCQAGPDYLAYAMIDAVIDAYFPVLERYGERLEALEDETIECPSRSTVQAIHTIKRDLLTLRRAVWPAREALNSLIRDPMPGIADETRLYLRDCYDHLVQLIDMLETYRETGGDLMEVYLSSVSNRLNEVMKVLTIISTIFMPLSFIAGVYGMNFRTDSPWNMPELGWRYGYLFVLAVMLTVAGAMVTFFWRRGWLGDRDSRGASRAARGSEAQGRSPPAQ